MQLFLIGVLTLGALGLNGAEGIARTRGNPPVRTNFFRGPALTAQEIEIVLELARQCGLEQPESIADVRILPDLKSIPRSLVVTSTEQVQGRKASRYYVRVGCSNWVPTLPAPSAKRLGDFYVELPYLRTNELSLVRFGTNVVRMSIGENIPLQLADAIVGKFARREVELSTPQLESDWTLFDVSEPTLLSKDRATSNYRIYFGTPIRQIIAFKYIGDRISITYIQGGIVY